jgi:hypothetical protein
MIESLKIGKYIFDRIKTITGYDSYPCIADNDVKFPYIVYNRNGLSTQLNKDGYVEDSISFEISIYSDKYAQSIIVADAVRSALEVMSSTSDDVLQIDNSVITNSNEQFIDNTFVQNIQWSADVTRYVDESGLSIIPSELNVLLEVSRTSGPGGKIVEYTDDMPEQRVYNIKVGESVVFPVLNRVYSEHGLKSKTVEYPEAYYRNNKVEVTWASSDANIVEVTENGLLCKTKGDANIQANYQDRYYVDVPVNVTNASKYIIDLKRPDDNYDFRVKRYKSYTEDEWGIQITPFTEDGIDYVRVTGIAPTTHAQNVEWSYYDDILPGWVTGQDMFKIFNVESGLQSSIDEYNEEVFWRGSSSVNSETIANSSIKSIPPVQIGTSIDMFNYPYVNGITCHVIDYYFETTVDVPVFTYNGETVAPADITYSIVNTNVVRVNNDKTKFIILINGGSTTITASYNGSYVEIPFTATKNSYEGTYTVDVDPADVTFSYDVNVDDYFTISGDKNNILTANNYYSYGSERHYSSHYYYTVGGRQFNGSKYFGNLTLSCTSRTIPSNTWINDLDTTTFSYNTYTASDTLTAYYDGSPANVGYNITRSSTTSIDSILTPITITDDNGEHKYVGITAYGGEGPGGNVEAFSTGSLSFTRPKYIIKIYSTRAYLDTLDESTIARFGIYNTINKDSNWVADTQVEGYDVCYTYSSSSNTDWRIYPNRFTEENKVLVLFSLGMNT